MNKFLNNFEVNCRFITENVDDVISVLDKNLNLIYINEAQQKISGYSIEELIGKNQMEFIHPVDVQHYIELYQKALRTGEGFGEFRFKRKNGSYVWLEGNAKIITDKNGETNVVFVSRDITKRKVMEDQLKESEEKFRTIAEQSLIGICILQNNVVNYLNRQFANIFGGTPEDVMNWTPGEYLNRVHPDSRDFVIDQAKKKQNGEKGAIFQYQFKALKLSGEEIWVEICSKTMFYQGRTADLILLTDITDKKLAEETLKESEEKFRVLYEKTHLGILLFTTEGVIIDCNHSFEKILGVKKEEIIGRKYKDLGFVPEKLIPILLQRLEKISKGEKIPVIELKVRKKNGEMIWARLKSTLVNVGTNSYIQMIGEDISEKKRAEIKLKKSERRYRMAYKRETFYKDLFAHDMGNILQILQGSSELLEMELAKYDKNEVLKELFNLFKNQLARGTYLIKNVKNFSELEKSSINLDSINVLNYLKKSIDKVKGIDDSKKIHINLHKIEEDYLVKADYFIEYVIDNILINAIKHNDKSAVEIEIKISKSKDNDRGFIKIEFIDNAKGIPDSLKDEVFNRITREENSRNGIGLGLSLVKKIIERYNAKVWVENRVKGEYPKGSNFILLIPEAK